MAKPKSMPAPKQVEEIAPEASEEEVSLDVEQDEEALMLDGLPKEVAKDVEPVVPKKKKSGPINVRATRPGFIYNSRKKEGDVFTIQSEEELGSWMEIL